MHLEANQAALRLELHVVEGWQRRCLRAKAKVAPILARLDDRVKTFHATAAVSLKKLASVAATALDQVEGTRSRTESSLAAAEELVRPEDGLCERAWASEEVAALEAAAADECAKPISLPAGVGDPSPSCSGVLTSHEAALLRARFQERAVFEGLWQQLDLQADDAHVPSLSVSSIVALLESLVDSLGGSASTGGDRNSSYSPGHGLIQESPNKEDLTSAATTAAAEAAAAAAAAADETTKSTKLNAPSPKMMRQETFVKLYATIKQGLIKGVKAPPRSFALLVNCRRRRVGWRALGEELLLRDSQALHRTNQAGVTALAAACHAGHLDVAEWCIAKGSDLNRGNMDGVTPVATAAARGHLAVVRALTEAGADVSTGNADGDSVVAIACWEDHHEIVRYLGGRPRVRLDSRNLDGITPLEVACMRGNLKSVMVLHALNVDMDEVNEHGDTPFLIACWEVMANNLNTNEAVFLHLLWCSFIPIVFFFIFLLPLQTQIGSLGRGQVFVPRRRRRGGQSNERQWRYSFGRGSLGGPSTCGVLLDGGGGGAAGEKCRRFDGL